jgi:hypothetical protein
MASPLYLQAVPCNWESTTRSFFLFVLFFISSVFAIPLIPSLIRLLAREPRVLRPSSPRPPRPARSSTSSKQMVTWYRQPWLAAAVCIGVASAVAVPDPTVVPEANPILDPAPSITPAARFFDGQRSYDRRNLVSDIANGADNVLHSLGSVLGQDLPSYVISGEQELVLQFKTFACIADKQ